MRWLYACLLVAGCGRLEFAELPRPDAEVADDGEVDAVPACLDTVCIDEAFATMGVWTLDVGGVANSSFGYRALAEQPEGKLVMVGRAGAGDVLVVRLLEDGTLDPAFGTAGIVTFDAGSTSDAGIGVAIQGDGKIVVVGAAGTSAFVARLEANGAIDTSFGLDGVTAAALGAISLPAFNGVAIDQEDHIVVGGQANFSPGMFNLLTARLRLDGTFDNGFGSNIDNGADDFGAFAAFSPAGQPLVVGQSYMGAARGFDGTIARLQTSDGALDPTFGTAGQVLVDHGASERFLNLVHAPDGDLVVAGQSTSGGATDALFARYAADGTQRASFGASGLALHDLGGDDQVRGLVALPDGRIVGGARVVTAAGERGVIVLLSPDGALLETRELPLPPPHSIDALVLDRRGRLLVVGDAGGADSDMLVARLVIP